MRKVFSAVLGASLLAAPIANAQCLRPDEVKAMDISWLKSQLMVTALTCRQDEKYNAFVVKYRPDLIAQDKALAGYFTRVNGRQGAKQRDDYVTQLANSQSQVGIKQGTAFCERSASILDEVQMLRNSAELADFAAAKGVLQPINVSACTGAPEPRAVAAKPTTRRARRR